MVAITDTASSVLLTERHDDIALVTLNRPQRMNALSAALIRTLVDTIAELDRDPTVGVIVITGTDPAFCAGVDLKEAAEDGGALALKEGMPTTGMFHPCSKPVIGAVNGPAVAGGLELALTCDFLIASDRARFADTHARVGVMPLAGLSVRLPRWIGLPRAKQMSLTGNFVDARTALAWGLVNEVVDHDDVVGRALAIARDISAHDREAVTHLRRTYDDAAAADEIAAWETEREMAAEWMPHGVDPAHIDQRRDAIIARGREQLR